MMTTTPVQFVAGSSDDIVIPLTDGDGADITDFTGWSAKVQLRYAPDHATVLHEWSSADGEITFADSAAVLAAPPVATSLAWPFRYVWFDLRVTDNTNAPSRPYRGPLEVIPAYTKDS